MKLLRHNSRISLALLALILSTLNPRLSTAFAQTFTIDWYSIDGGGGLNGTGEVFTVSGTIGAPDAGATMKDRSGVFAVDGGFWSLIAVVQQPGAPELTISLTTTNTALLSWPYPSTGFALQQNTNVVSTNWTSVTNTVSNDGMDNHVIVNPPSGNRFYRLCKP